MVSHFILTLARIYAEDLATELIVQPRVTTLLGTLLLVLQIAFLLLMA